MHSFKRSHGQCCCHWCGVRFPCRGQRECVPDEVKVAVADFAHKHGRTWKAELRLLWLRGKDEGRLRHARNAIGPRQLDNVTSVMLDHVRRLQEKRDAIAANEEEFRRIEDVEGGAP